MINFRGKKLILVCVIPSQNVYYDKVQFVCVIKWRRVKLGNNFTRVLSKSL